MTDSIHVKIADLPFALQSALSGMGYKRDDIEIQPREQEQAGCGGGKGSRGIFVAVRLDTGAVKGSYGAYGGSNPFTKAAADDRNLFVDIPPHTGAVIHGSSNPYGGSPYVRVSVHPDTLAKLLPDTGADLTDRDRGILAVFKSIRGGHRAEYLERWDFTEDDRKRLAAAGYIKVSRNGATRITTDGRNAAGSEYYPRRTFG